MICLTSQTIRKMFAQLIANSSSSQTLSDYISDNSSLIYEFVGSSIEVQRQQKDMFEEFVLLGSRVQILDSMDFSRSQNRAFIAILFDYAERVNASAVLLQLYQIIQKHNLDVGSRLKASILYLYNVPNNQVYIDRFDDICSKLQTAIDEEEDNDSKAIATFLNYYSSIIYNTAPHVQFAQELQSKALASCSIYPFLQKDVITASISLDVNQTDFVYSTIQATIDRLLGKQRRLMAINDVGFIIESNTNYAQLLSNCPRRFNSIRDIAISQLQEIQNSDEVFRSLGRGVAILEQEEQLFSYMKSYGLMHKAKLLAAFSHFPFNEIKDNNIDIYDWSCGQGLASIVLLEYLMDNNIVLKTNRVTLIEPSEIALKRASLHVKHFDSEVTVRTILKDMDSLEIADVSSIDGSAQVHLFSNILDVETYSMQHLIEIIKQGFKGNNYMFCVSPYINDVKTARLDSFVNSFSEMPQFNMIFQDIASRGEWTNNWTKLIKTFKVTL